MFNVVLITIDCLRKDCFTNKLLPNLFTLKKNSVLFENAYSVSSWTAPSFIGLLTSSYPLMYGGSLKIDQRRKTITEVLRINGYHTVGFTYHPYLDRMFGYNKGFCDYYDDMGEHSETSKTLIKKVLYLIGKYLGDNKIAEFLKYIYYVKTLEENLKSNYKFYIPAKQINEKVICYIKENKLKTPFFLWIHYMDAHFPYMPKNQDENKILELNIEREKYFRGNKTINLSKINEIKSLYLNEIRELDINVYKIINKLNLLYPKTIFIITSDHGEEFYEHEGFHHELTLYNELIHVPLMIFNNEINHNVNKQLISLIDVGPTILDIIGIEKPQKWLGNSILSNINEYIICEEGQKYRGEARKHLDKFKLYVNSSKIAVITKKYKYIYYKKGRNELYNILNDPNEKNNIINELQCKSVDDIKNILYGHIKMLKENDDSCARRGCKE